MNHESRATHTGITDQGKVAAEAGSTNKNDWKNGWARFKPPTWVEVKILNRKGNTQSKEGYERKEGQLCLYTCSAQSVYLNLKSAFRSEGRNVPTHIIKMERLLNPLFPS